MVELRNGTRFPAQIVPFEIKGGDVLATALIKGTFVTNSSRRELSLSEQQIGPILADEYYGEPDKTSVRYASDLVPRKLGTDVALVGRAYARSRGGGYVDVSLAAGGVEKVVRVFGDRIWTKKLLALVPGPAHSFEHMPITYERAFGGADKSEQDPGRRAADPRNPIGVGFSTSIRAVEGNKLPNIEDPARLISRWDDRPAPAGFGFIAGSWAHRAQYAGTYDEAWRRMRMPLLPDDFDERFYSASSPGLLLHRPLRGGEPVSASNVTRQGEFVFNVPTVPLSLVYVFRGKRIEVTPSLHTLLIEPDEHRVCLTWHACLSVGRRFLDLQAVEVRARGHAAEAGGLRD